MRVLSSFCRGKIGKDKDGVMLSLKGRWREDPPKQQRSEIADTC